MIKRHIKRETVFSIIRSNWPIHITEIAEKMNLLKNDEERKAVIAHLSYHIRELVKKGKIKSKRIGKANVVWPSEVENIKAMRDFMENI